MGDVVKLRRPGGRVEVGQVHYIGHLTGKCEPFVGVELEHASQFISLASFVSTCTCNRFEEILVHDTEPVDYKLQSGQNRLRPA